MNKISIRFYQDKEVRAVWDEEGNKWWFSVVDIVASITKSENPNNYWKVFKSRLKKSNPQLVTKCNQLKLTAADGKKYLSGRINKQNSDRELFMKEIDCSYYYEEN